MENTDKDKLREGTSLRAQAYRLKDQLLNFSYADLQKHCENKEIQATVQEKFGVLHEHLKTLVKKENDPTAGEGAVAALNEISKLLTDSGFTPTNS